MIVKFLSRHSPGGFSSLINYILNPEKGNGNAEITPYLHNFKGNTKTEWLKELYQNEAFRQRSRSDQVYFYHAILSFSNQDSNKISSEMLMDFSKQFVSLRGKEGMYLSASHHDRNHTHIHFLISALEYKTGKAFRMNKDQFQELKIELQNYQIEKYPFLVNSLPQHGSGKEYLTNREYGAKVKNSKSYLKSQISQKVNDILLESKSIQNFTENLGLAGLHHYERGGKVYGVTIDDKNYRFSGLGVEMDKFNSLEDDLSEEEQALEEIQSLRNETESMEMEYSISEPDISE
jgi:hypothetical protein